MLVLDQSSYAVACVVAVSRFVFTLVPLTIIGRIKRRKSGHKQFLLNLAPEVDDSVQSERLSFLLASWFFFRFAWVVS